MRFFKDGPSIPDYLLERRDQGRVVFLCGAGVSKNAGMPTFYELTKGVVDFFDPPKNSAIESEFRPWVEDSESGKNRPKTPLDQIFHLLYQEYGRDEVNSLVAERLWSTGTSNTESIEHSVIARISSDQEGRPQIVTTNFDLLFELGMTSNGSQFYEPPAFPDLSLGVPLTGITYLHGRLQAPDAKLHPYVLSSADFGRAYLSEGWATNFIRSLLKSYTVVLVGYQAEDPPVKYLLQGLNYDGLSDRSNLYAFDKGKPEEIEAKWRDRGVTAVACKDYPSLWQSLEAWADRADDPRQWRSNVINMAMKGPRQLAAHERGQVAHLVRTTPGARLFAKADPSPPTEWLCVFDTRCRLAEESSGYRDGSEIFDPFKEYGLDDDLPRPLDLDKQSKWDHDHILEWRRGDTNPTDLHRLSWRPVSGFESLPPRLCHLSDWIIKQFASPVVAWWAVRQQGLHPTLVNGILRELRGDTEVSLEVRRAWNLILEYHSNSRNYSMDHGWLQIKDRIQKEGWTSSVLRDFEAVTAPLLTRTVATGVCKSKPPFGSWEDIKLSELASWEVKFPDRYGEALDVPDSVVESVFRIAEGHIHRAIGLMDDFKKIYFDVPTCYLEREVEGRNHDGQFFFSWFLELFALMVSKFPVTARAHAVMWPVGDRFYFRGLKLFALNQTELFEADEAAESLLELSQECFWDTNVRRELLFLINDRWQDFSETNRKALAERLFNGPDKTDRWSDKEYPKIRDEMACRYIRWLTLQGKELPEQRAAQLDAMLSALPEWKEEWASSLAQDTFGFIESFGTDETPDRIIDLPVCDVIEHAQAEHCRDFDRFTERRPFTGLVKVNPRKALASLSHKARGGEFPKVFWSTLINDWPDETSPRLFRVFLHRLGRLTHEAIRELRDPVGRWLQEKLLSAYTFDKALAWNTFDHLLSGLISDEGAATGSGILERRIGGEIVERSRRTIDHAINGPVGHAMQGLHNTLGSLNLAQGAEIPEEFKSRIECLLVAPGEGGDHSVAVTTRQIHWLNYLDPEWIKERVMPWFSFDHSLSEPAWNGYLSAGKLPPNEIGIALKPLLLELFPRLYTWSWDQRLATVAVQIVIALSVFYRDEPYGLTAKEARHCLRDMSDKNRQDAIFRLGVIGKREEDGWLEKVIPFIEAVWPRERAFRTSNLVFSWISLLDDTGEKFPEVLTAVRRFLVPVEGESHWLYQFSREVGGKEPLTTKYPADVLELLDAVIPNSVEDVPYELAQILDLIEEADSALVSDRRFVRLIDLIEQT